jgi:hypothetical protein
MLDLLLRHYPGKEHVNQGNHHGITPLHVAACCGSLKGVQRLLEAGADISARDRHNNTPLDALADHLYILINTAQAKAQKQSDLQYAFLTAELNAYLEVFRYLHDLCALQGVSLKTKGITKRAPLSAVSNMGNRHTRYWRTY